MKELETELKASLEGELYLDETTRHIYSVDASIFEILPLGVIVPKSEKDIQATLSAAAHFNIPVTARGAATGITGGCLGRGLILDLSKYLNRILELNVEEEYAICEPGVIQDALNRELHPLGYRLGPDTSTGNRATIGGMLANNSAGSRSLRYGKMSDHVQEVELILSNGETVVFSSLTESGWALKKELPNREGAIYQTLWTIKEEDEEEIRRRFPNIPRRVSGYNLDELLATPSFNPSKIIAGSEGTLGIASKIKMGIVKLPKTLGLLLVSFDSLLESFQKIDFLLQFQPFSIEVIDNHILSLGHSSPQLRGKLSWLDKESKALLIIEIEGEHPADAENKIDELKNELIRKKIGSKHITILDPFKMADVWSLRKAGLGLLLSKRSFTRAIAFLEDLAVPPAALAPFMEKYCSYLQAHHKEAGIYGHAGAGCMHLRPYINLRDPDECAFMKQMMLDISSLVLDYGGSLSGEHGDGLIRSWLNPKMFGDKIMHDFQKIKQAFDPLNLMNPGKIIPLDQEWESLRNSPGEKLQSPSTFLDFQSEGGFELAADLCNGNGQCRKDEGIMCPSYQATRSEFHSTRARAQSLRAIIHRKLPLESFTSHGLHKVMDLCLSCKGCKTECPSQIDMAKFKSEFLYHYQQKHGFSLRTRLFSSIGKINQALSPFARYIDRLSRSWPMKMGFRWLGISANRQLPPLANERFSSWLNLYTQPPELDHSVVLLNDTFTEFNHPEIGQAAVKLLNACGFHVLLPPWNCCGRPAISHGMLPMAQSQAIALIESLLPFTDEKIPILGLEPSCLFTLQDDYPTFFQLNDNLRKAFQAVSSQCQIIDVFLANLFETINPQALFHSKPLRVIVHGHCHQKSSIGMEKTMQVLKSVPGIEASLIDSGCCGMAGSFGYEKEHEEISLEIGELRLFPAIRRTPNDAVIIANGTSCRQQIQFGTGNGALHLVEALANKLKDK